MVETKEFNSQTRESTVSPRVLSVLASKNVSLDDVLRMTRQEFEALTSEIHRLVPRDDKKTLIQFKHSSMTKAEMDAYFEPTEEEYDEIERDPEYQPFVPALTQPHH